MDGLVKLTAKRPTPAEVVAGVDAQAERILTDYPDGRILWRTWGSGPPLVLLHGGSGGWTHWIRNVMPLARSRRVIAPDMPGFGDSGEVPHSGSVQSIADAVALGLPALVGTDAFPIVGFSFGALVGGFLAARPECRVAGLVLVGAVGLGLRRNPLELISWRRLTDEAERREAHRANLATLMIHDPRRIDHLAQYLQQRNAERSRTHSRRFARSTPLNENLLATDVALAGIWGEHDVTAAPFIEDRREMLQRLRPGAPFEVIEGAGHWVQYEAAEAFNSALLRILDSPAMTASDLEMERERPLQQVSPGGIP